MTYASIKKTSDNTCENLVADNCLLSLSNLCFLTQEINNIREWHSKATEQKVEPSKPKISQSAKAAAGKIGEIMRAALQAPGRVGTAIANKVQGKKEGQGR